MTKTSYYIVIILTIILVACDAEPRSTNDNHLPMAKHHVEKQLEERVQSNHTSDHKLQHENGENMVKPKKHSQYRINEQTWAVEPIADANEKVVLLTIDDAPDKYTLEMASILKELDANAIFFVNGHFLQTAEAKETLQEIYQLGFIIGNHTYTHPNLQNLTEDEQREEIVGLNDLVEDIIGERPKFFRAPFGVNTDTVRDIVQEEQMILMNWTFGYDWMADYHSAEKLIDVTLHAPELNNGANILMHDREWTSMALKDIVLGLQEQGYEIVDPHLLEVIE